MFNNLSTGNIDHKKRRREVTPVIILRKAIIPVKQRWNYSSERINSGIYWQKNRFFASNPPFICRKGKIGLIYFSFSGWADLRPVPALRTLHGFWQILRAFLTSNLGVPVAKTGETCTLSTFNREQQRSCVDSVFISEHWHSFIRRLL
jgi:hypothetical protein